MFEEFLRHVVGHPDAAMRGIVARQVASVHADAAIKAHEVPHRGSDEFAAGWDFIHTGIGVVVDDLSGDFVLDDAVEVGPMVFVLLGDLIRAGRGIVALLAGGDARDSDKFGVLVEKCLLLTEVDGD